MPKIKVLLGLPGSGKTTRAIEMGQTQVQWVRVNKDSIRDMLSDGRYSPAREEVVKSLWREAIRSALKQGWNVVIDDAGSLKPRTQGEIVEIVAELMDEGVVVELEWDRQFLKVPPAECIKRDLQRARSVGADVIWNFHKCYCEHSIPIDVEKSFCAIVDVDGTLALLNGRNPLDYMAAESDTVNPAVSAILQFGLPLNVQIVILTGREESGREVLESWLNEHLTARSSEYISTRIKVVHMRPDGDRRKGAEFKMQVLTEKILPEYNVVLWIDDDPQVITEARSRGIPVMQVG